MYQEWPADPALAADVACLWVATTSPGNLVLPDGSADIILLPERAIVVGPDSTAADTGLPLGTPIVGVRFRPGRGGRVLGVPLTELRDRRADLSDLWGTGGRQVGERAAQVVDDPRAGVALLTGLVRRRLAEVDAPDRAVDGAVRLLGRGAPVATTAAEVGLSVRTLHRRLRDAVGYGPKTLGRVMRLQRFLRLVRDRPANPLAELAIAAGYADQAHLSRDCRDLARRTPAALAAANRPPE